MYSTVLSIEPLTIEIRCPFETAGPASTSNPSNEGAEKVLSSGLALSENSTRKASPTATVKGAWVSKVTFSAPYAEKTASTVSAVKNIFAKNALIDSYRLAFCNYNDARAPLLYASGGF